MRSSRSASAPPSGQSGHGRLRDRERHGDGACRLRRDRGHARPSRRADHAADHRRGQRRRCSTRSTRPSRVNLSSPVERDDRATARALGTITDDDPLPALSVNDVTVTEGNAGTVNADLHGHARRRQRPDGHRRLRDRERHRDAPADYTAATGTLTFAPGETTQDGHRAGQRRLSTRSTRPSSLNLTNASQRDDRRRPRASARSPTTTAAVALDRRRHGHRRRRAARSTRPSRSRSRRPAARRSRVDYATATARRPRRPTTPATSGTLTFAAGQTTQDGHGARQRRPARRGDETFAVNLSNPVNATIADAQRPRHDHRQRRRCRRSRSTTSPSTEGNTGTVDATFTVTLHAPSGRAVTVDYATANGTATAPADYTATQRRR